MRLIWHTIFLFLLIQRYKFEPMHLFGYFICNAKILRYTSWESL